MEKTDYEALPMSAWLRKTDREVKAIMELDEVYGCAPSLDEMKHPGEAHTPTLRCPSCSARLRDERAAQRAYHRGGCLSCHGRERRRKA